MIGIQIGPISFLDEGVPECLDVLQSRVGIDSLMIATVSWLGLKVGRRISHEIEGWPDHGIASPAALQGGSFIRNRPAYYANTSIRNFASADPTLAGRDILDLVIPEARRRGMKVIPEFMEPLFKYAGHGSASEVTIPGMPQHLEIDLLGRHADEPCTSNAAYRRWWHSMIEEHCKNYDIDGIMWCNERNSPLDRMMQGQKPGCFCKHCRREAAERNIDVEQVRAAFRPVWRYFEQARAGAVFADGAFLEFLRVLLQNPEVLLWERFWLERNKDLDRELHGIVKWCNPKLSFGLNIWNRNHFNPVRRAQWSWSEQTEYADWVKPITYQHQAGQVFAKEMGFFGATLFRDFTLTDWVPAMQAILGLDKRPIDQQVAHGMDPDTYVYDQCADAVRGVIGKVPVYMGIGVDAPRTSSDEAVCTPEIVYRSVHATYRAGGKGVVFSPSYAGMNLSNLDGGARALAELELKS